MNINIPFTKELIFKSKIAEIVSISLEEDTTINDHELLGDFIVSGEYKNLDVNVLANPFNYVIPFKVSLDDNIDIKTLKYKINDFTYEIIGDDTLKVEIVMHVDADSLPIINEDIFEKVDEEDLRIDNEESSSVIVEDDNVKKRELIANDALENDFITYHLHTVKITDTLETISKEYKVSVDELLLINDITNVSSGDKILIPLINEDK